MIPESRMNRASETKLFGDLGNQERYGASSQIYGA
jgi:hypothetical protein